jgi:DNA repair protein RecO (recombination protein O)
LNVLFDVAAFALADYLKTLGSVATMPLQDGEAIVLRCFDLAEVDRIAVLFTREFGKIRGVAPGSKRLKSGFMGSLDTGTHIRVKFLEKEGLELVRFRQAQVLDHYAAHSDLPRLLHLIYMTELLDAFSTDRNSNPDLFRLSLACFQGLKAGGIPGKLARYFEYWILRLEGIWPGIRRCGMCDAPLSNSEVVFSRNSGCFTCRDCRIDEGIAMDAADLGVLQEFAKLPPSQLLPAGDQIPSLGKLEVIAQTIMRRHLEFDIKSYRVLKELTAA